MTKLIVCKDILYYEAQVSDEGIANKNKAYLANWNILLAKGAKNK